MIIAAIIMLVLVLVLAAGAGYALLGRGEAVTQSEAQPVGGRVFGAIEAARGGSVRNRPQDEVSFRREMPLRAIPHVVGSLGR